MPSKLVEEKDEEEEDLTAISPSILMEDVEDLTAMSPSILTELKFFFEENCEICDVYLTM